jgi:hypothetical protein
MDDGGKTAITRREFARRAAFAGAAATLAGSPAMSQSVAVPTPAASTQASGAATGASAAQSESELRVRTILALYPDRFSDVQKADLLKISASTQKALDRLRAHKVENSDEPALHLKPLMEREKKAAALGVPAVMQKPQGSADSALRYRESQAATKS